MRHVLSVPSPLDVGPRPASHEGPQAHRGLRPPFVLWWLQSADSRGDAPTDA